MDKKEIVINFDGINEVINLLENCEKVFYNTETQEYEFDGVIIKERFLYETCSKFSHYINIINNTLMNKKQNLKSVEVSNKQVLDMVETMYGAKKKGKKDAKS
jgi:hypothetical protein